MSLAKILKNCPKGIKLYSSIYGEMEFVKVTEIARSIHCLTNKGNSHYFYPDGRYEPEGECVLFPSKKQREWNEFMIPFKDGDIIIKTELNHGCEYYNIAIFKSYNNSSTNKMNVYCQVNGANEFRTEMSIHHQNWRLASTNEIKRFFTRMNESGYDFKEGRLVVIPVFKVGDIITNGKLTFKIGHIDDEYYYEVGRNTSNRIFIITQDKWKLKKFDIHSLKPYDKVLVKNDDSCWYPSLVSYVNSSGRVYTIDDSDSAEYVIPFESNEHLVGKFDDPDPYYITWQE